MYGKGKKRKMICIEISYSVHIYFANVGSRGHNRTDSSPEHCYKGVWKRPKKGRFLTNKRKCPQKGG